MSIGSIYKKIALISPRMEVLLRYLYWKNVKWLGKFNPNKPTKSSATGETKHVDFEKVIDWLKSKGVGEGSLLIVHSSYDALQCTGLSPVEIIKRLKELIGVEGTLAMPAIRNYKEEPSAYEMLKNGVNGLVCEYDIRRTPVMSGLLPYTLLRMKDAEISKHPLNPLCAIGPLAKEMMKHNIEGEYPSPHGKNSSWKFCYDNGAIVIGLGTDLRHHNTMGHVAEEAFGNWHWTDEQWYDLRDFIIKVPHEEPFSLTVKNRKPKWGMLHQAELNRYKDFLDKGIIKSIHIGSILLELEKSEELINYLQTKNKNGYPYF